MEKKPYLCVTCRRYPDVRWCFDDRKCAHFVGTNGTRGSPAPKLPIEEHLDGKQGNESLKVG